jgi:hypothetical protein
VGDSGGVVGEGGKSLQKKKKKREETNWVRGGEKIKFQKIKLGRGRGENKVAKKRN